MLPYADYFHYPAVLCVSYQPLYHPGGGSPSRTLQLEMESTLTAAHGKVVRDGSKDPAVERLAKTLNNVSVRVRQAGRQSLTRSWSTCWRT